METGMKGSFTTRKGALYCIVMTCLCSLLATAAPANTARRRRTCITIPTATSPSPICAGAEKSFNTTMVMGTTMVPCSGAVIGASQTGKAEGALAGAPSRGSRGRAELSRRQVQQREGRPRPPRQLCPRSECRRQFPEPRNRRRAGGLQLLQREVQGRP